MNIDYAVKIIGSIVTNASVSLSGNLTTNYNTLTGSVAASTVDRNAEPYEGPYVIEPQIGSIVYGFSEGDITLNTNNKKMTSNVVIKPIAPTQELNFAKVTWDGTRITVS